MMEVGEFAEAAQLLVRLSQGARRQGRPVRAGNLAARASQAYLAHDRVGPALDQMRLAIRLLVQGGQVQRATHLVSRAADELTERGFQTEARELKKYADRLREGAGLPPGDWHARPPSQAPDRPSSLPGRCQGCGAALIPDDVIWHDAQTAECAYCGAVVKAI